MSAAELEKELHLWKTTPLCTICCTTRHWKPPVTENTCATSHSLMGLRRFVTVTYVFANNQSKWFGLGEASWVLTISIWFWVYCPVCFDSYVYGRESRFFETSSLLSKLCKIVFYQGQRTYIALRQWLIIWESKVAHKSVFLFYVPFQKQTSSPPEG